MSGDFLPVRVPCRKHLHGPDSSKRKQAPDQPVPPELPSQDYQREQYYVNDLGLPRRPQEVAGDRVGTLRVGVKQQITSCRVISPLWALQWLRHNIQRMFGEPKPMWLSRPSPTSESMARTLYRIRESPLPSLLPDQRACAWQLSSPVAPEACHDRRTSRPWMRMESSNGQSRRSNPWYSAKEYDAGH